ncbi:Uncharacterized protein dnm_077100 [Desulfonema magnum]|uniref:Uncharacterized protein n=1 Tax=Desulfonema magnum TaxID=45655 RepID=A0A975BUR7_9BACT|nr:Uncharacterized protein dnm_077100 [Desulfonema magnum]
MNDRNPGFENRTRECLSEHEFGSRRNLTESKITCELRSSLFSYASNFIDENGVLRSGNTDAGIFI